MILINFSHPLTADQLAQLEALAGQRVERTIDRPVEFDLGKPFVSQVVELADSLGLSATEWQTVPLVVNPPALNLIAAVLLAELHGRMGYFPTVVRLRPVENSTPVRFEVAELINLQEVRARSRRRRA
jgi:hypothetical protein